MKKLLYFLALMLLCMSCGNDDHGNDALTSTITIGSEEFLPSVPDPGNNSPVVTDFTQAQGSDSNRRLFTILDSQNQQHITIVIGYPISQESVTDTYEVTNNDGAHFAQVYYGSSADQSSSLGQSGSITVEDLGGSRYELNFENITVENALGEQRVINGSIRGKFTNN